MNIKL